MPGDQESPSRGVLQTGEEAPARARGEDLFGQVLAPHPDEVESTPQRFGAGRPKGSRNRSSEDIARMVQQIGGHPVLAMARVAGMSLKEIKEMLGCNRLEAFDRWLTVLDKLAPYVASKQPLAVAVSGKIANLNLTVPAGPGVQLGGPDAIEALFAQGLARARDEGFEVPALPAAAQQENDDETDT